MTSHWVISTEVSNVAWGWAKKLRADEEVGRAGSGLTHSRACPAPVFTGYSSVVRVPDKAFPFDLAGLTIGMTTIAAFFGGFRAFYYGGDFLASFSYVSDERTFNEIVNSWIGRDPQETLFGVHAFGDYLLLSIWSSFDDPWGQMEGVNYPPPILLVYRLLGLLPYEAGFWLYMFGLASCLVAPMIMASRNFPVPTRMLLVATLAVLTGPTIATLDRGNSQGFLPILLFGFGIAVMKKRWGWAAIAIAIAASIKIYPIVLVLMLIALGKYRWSAVALGWSVALFLITLPLMSTAGLSGLPVVVGDILGWQERGFDDFLSYNVSFAGGLANGAALFGLDSVAAWIAANPLVIVALYAVVVIPLLWIKGIELWLRVVLAISLPTTLMPIVYAYALNWILAATALAVWASCNMVGGGVIKPLVSRVLLLAFALGTAVLPVFIPGSAESGRPAGAVSLAAVVVALALPIAVWLSRTADSTQSHKVSRA